MSGIHKAAKVVKSVQRGTTVINSVNSITQAITSVDTNKAVLHISCKAGSGTSSDGRDNLVQGEMTSDVLLTFSRGSTSGSVSVAWEVVEYY